MMHIISRYTTNSYKLMVNYFSLPAIAQRILIARMKRLDCGAGQRGSACDARSLPIASN